MEIISVGVLDLGVYWTYELHKRSITYSTTYDNVLSLTSM